MAATNGTAPQPHERLNGQFEPPSEWPTKSRPDARKDVWYYPADLANDLKDVGLSAAFAAETLACAFEYTKCIIPQYTNWAR